MKYVFQLMLILTISLAGELLYALLPLPVPASIYGLVILFVLLLTKRIKLEQVEETADFLMSIMPLFFIDSTVKTMNTYGLIKGRITALVLASFLSFAAVTIVTGLTAQGIIRMKKRKGKSNNEY